MINLANFLSSFPLPSQSTILKVAAIAVASPRYMGAFGLAVGASVHQDYSWLVGVEVYSGLAMAILEGWAIAYIFSKWRLLQKASLDWFILLGALLLLLILLPLIATPYMLAMQNDATVQQLFSFSYGTVLQVIWSFLISLIPVLIIAAVGYADFDPTQQKLASLSKVKTLELAKVQQNQQLSEAKQQAGSSYICECGKGFATHQALNGHKAKCKLKLATVSQNGATK